MKRIISINAIITATVTLIGVAAYKKVASTKVKSMLAGGTK